MSRSEGRLGIISVYSESILIPSMLEPDHAVPVTNSMKPLICLKEKGRACVRHYVDRLAEMEFVIFDKLLIGR